MKTAELIAALARNVRPVRKGAVTRKLTLGIVIGALLTFGILLLTLRLRNLSEAVQTYPFWMKLAFTGTLSIGGLFALSRLARSAGAARAGLLIIAAAAAGMLCLAAAEMIVAPPDERYALWLGETARVCSLLIVLLAIPIFGALITAMRSLAPTHLTAAGTAIGLTSGAIAATIYGLHCPESSAAFVTTWYSLGIAATTGAGVLIGPRALRW
jgi:hypothetical protein